MKTPDVSVILNVHREAVYLPRTLRSIEHAVEFAQFQGLRCELVIVADRPDQPTRDFIERHNFDKFDEHVIVFVDNGSLGLSRNDGIRASTGDYIWTLDGDDLISYNAFSEAFLVANNSPGVIWFTQYVMGFGENAFVWEYFGSDVIEDATLFSSHPFVSHIFAHRDVFLSIPYADASLAQGYAYEDWHFNCNAIALGFRFATIPNTVLFYRQRQASLLKQSNDRRRVIPHSAYFEPLAYLRTCSSQRAFAHETTYSRPCWQETRQKIMSSVVVTEIVAAVNQYDNAINFDVLANSPVGTNIPEDFGLGAKYLEVCKLVGGSTFTDVFLMPFLVAGGGEKYVLQVANGLQRLDPSRRSLFLFGQIVERHDWLDKLPDNSCLVDLAALCRHDQEGARLLAFRLIQSVAPDAQIHIKCSPFANDFISDYGRYLSKATFNYYYFCDSVSTHNGVSTVNGYNFQFVSEMAVILHRVISDHTANIEFLKPLIHSERLSFHTLKASEPNRTLETGGRLGRESPAFKLLWASRLDSQKRPDLLVKIAANLAATMPDLRIDIYGAAKLEGFDGSCLAGLANVAYRGGFLAFDDLNHADYDALLYTSLFDGIPNIILEAMARGLLVIAPQIGGIGEALGFDRGFLIENSSDDSELVNRYVATIRRMYDNWEMAKARRQAASHYVATDHSIESHLTSLARIFL